MSALLRLADTIDRLRHELTAEIVRTRRQARRVAAGDVDLAVYRTSARRQDAGIHPGTGAGVGVAYEHATRSRDLVRAWAVTRGGPLREREDCSAR